MYENHCLCFSSLPFVAGTWPVKNSATGTQTDNAGNFTIQAGKNDTLVFSFLNVRGYSSINGGHSPLVLIDKWNIPFLPIPASLGEDQLANFGAYREYE